MSTGCSKDYREDVDGLRAIAILSVILFHLDKDILQGGFVGVDMFFVISGFLITSHIANDCRSSNGFSFIKFYLRRIRRIIPALLGTILVTLIAGSIIFSSYNFEKLGSQSFSAILSFSNIYFFLESGYFDDDSIFKPLLHTWSLGIEEQFYLIWPIILFYFLNRFTLKDLRWLTIFLGTASFILNYIYVEYREAIFYLMPFRIFEFSIGGYVSYLMLRGVVNKAGYISNIISAIGLSMIIVPMFILDENSIFPFYNALSPTIGTAIIIYSRNTIVNRLLSTRILVLIGLISYSLYLYHWPIIVFTSYIRNGILSNYDYLIIIVLTLIFSIASYHYVEKTIRFSRNRWVLVSLSFVAILLAVTSALIKNGNIHGMSYHEHELISTSELRKSQAMRYSLVQSGKKGCSAGNLESTKCNLKADIQVITMGNSHAIDAYNVFYPQLENNDNVNLIHFRTTTGCNYEISDDSIISSNGKCNVHAKILSDIEFIDNIDLIIVHYFRFKSWGAIGVDLIDFIRNRNADTKIIVLGAYLGVRPNKCFDLVNKANAYSACKEVENITYTGDEDVDWIFEQRFAKTNFMYIDSLLMLCGKEKKHGDCKVKLENSLVFYDGDHLSIEGAKLLGERAFIYYAKELSDLGLK